MGRAILALDLQKISSNNYSGAAAEEDGFTHRRRRSKRRYEVNANGASGKFELSDFRSRTVEVIRCLQFKLYTYRLKAIERVLKALVYMW